MKPSKLYLRSYQILLTGIFLLAACFSGCKKEITRALPGSKTDVALNFYSASAVFSNVYNTGIATTAVYVDKNLNLKGPLANNVSYNFVNFNYGIGPGFSEYPATTEKQGINYIRYVSGAHHLMFTDTTLSIVLDTTINLTNEDPACLYFADQLTGQGAKAAYKLVRVSEGQAVPAGKTGVRFIHLSPDAGSLEAALQKADGGTTSLFTGLKFTEASAYQYFDEKDMVSGLLRFNIGNAANGIAIVTGVPFNAGHSYVVVVNGFLNPQQRQFANGKNPDGTPRYTLISIPGKLTTTIRTSF